MKRILTLILGCLICVLAKAGNEATTPSQTINYIKIAVSENGVRSDSLNTSKFFTFSDNNNLIVESDRTGSKKGYQFRYSHTEDGLLIYKPISPRDNKPHPFPYYDALYISPDHESIDLHLGSWTKKGEVIYHYERKQK